MCIVCGGGGQHLLRAIVGRHAAVRAPSRLTATAVAPEARPPLDPLAPLAGPADVILRGGPILTMAAPAEAIALRAGRILAVGDAEVVLARRGRLTRVIDLDGRALLPGFVNAHWHMPYTLLCDWVDSPARLSEAAAAAAPGEFIVVAGQGAPPPLDGIANPAVAVDAAGRILAGNRLAGPLPAHVSGLLPRFPAAPGPIRARLRRLLAQTAAAGVTCLRVCGVGGLTGADDVALLRDAMGEAPRLRLRGALDAALWPEWQAQGLRPGAGDDAFRLDAVAAWLDAGPPPEAARAAGWPLVMHAGDDAQVATALQWGGAVECRHVPAIALPAGFGFTFGDGPAPALPDRPLSLGMDVATGPSQPLAMLDRAVAAGLPLTRALEAVTIQAARRCGADAIVGSLEVGKYADLVLLDGDPRHRALQGIRVSATWLGGLDVFRA